MTAVVPFVGALGEPEEPPKHRAFLERQQFPSPTRIKHSAKWWLTEGLKGLVALTLKAPYLAVCELVPIGRGLGRILSGWARWCAVADYKELISDADGNKKADRGKELIAKRSANRKLSFLAVLILAGGGAWAYFNYPLYLALAGVLVVLICDVAGRAGTEKAVSLPPPMRTVLKEGVPLTQITAAILDTLAREGFEEGSMGVASPLRYDGARHEYRMRLSLLDEIRPEHLRAIERGIGASNHAVRILATDISTVRELVIRDGDPLKSVPRADWIETGSISIEQPVDLGVSMTETPLALLLAGQHVKCVMGTGGGKTAWCLRNLIDRLSACRDVVLWGVDLTRGPELPLWRAVIQKVAHTPDDADALLDSALAEIDRRAKILAGFAEDDDPANDDITEWCSQLGPYLVIIIDEFSTLAEYNGKPQGELDLLAKAKGVVRVGRKHGVGLVMASQRTGNDDFGSTVMTSLANTTLAGPCAPDDSVRLFGKDGRDAGWTPHELQPGTPSDPRDAGKVYIQSPIHGEPDIYRFYLPLAAGEVKRRARQRIADGLPVLDGRTSDVVEAQELPTILVDVEKAFSDFGDPDKLATADLLRWLNANGYELDAKKLADQLRPLGLRPNARWRPAPGVDSIRGYHLADVQDALGRFE